ncbi:hypothetical protein E2553_23795 [Paraburkholderia dipogonis]|uniref:Uncharacterized protein n=1 Tax=Paraburkholderia dipogonis TaxID=1211383 RepID=A0A4Y8MQQ4_9BURK|nr:hypothetical protein [Paraburkholderia dipogonis]TFE39826.1 hypothetical protein E2553_23795 [Paraburkholderia dipogonis]
MKLIDSPHRVKITRDLRRYSSNSLRDSPAEVPIMGIVRDKGMPTAMEPTRQSYRPHLSSIRRSQSRHPLLHRFLTTTSLDAPSFKAIF